MHKACRLCARRQNVGNTVKNIKWVDFTKFMSDLMSLHGQLGNDILLFRGQPCGKPLLPKIAREISTMDSTSLEREMLNRLRKQGHKFPEVNSSTDLDLLAIAQHHGMATRLLDWSSNPLVALWFACVEPSPLQSAHLYIYKASEETVLNSEADLDPFSFSVTKIFQPPHNSARVAAQCGWFSVHPYYAQSGFQGLDEDMIHFLWVYHLEIPAAEKPVILEKLDVLGVNHRSLFPDLDGLCRHITWEHTSKWPAKTL